jgi:hypothetical protein
LGVLLLGFPLQYILVRIMFLQRSKGVEITDSRVRLTNEVSGSDLSNRHVELNPRIQVLQGIRLIKYYAWEDFYTHQIGTLRQREIATVRNMGSVSFVCHFRCMSRIPCATTASRAHF